MRRHYHHNWFSNRFGRQMQLLAYGHSGTPALRDSKSRYKRSIYPHDRVRRSVAYKDHVLPEVIPLIRNLKGSRSKGIPRSLDVWTGGERHV